MIVRESAGGVVECLAPAKLNLFLEVLGQRPDGYHELETVMVAVSLFDTLRCTDDPSGRITLHCDDPGLPVGAENLVVRAAEALRRSAGVERGATIDLHKAIPAQAGLGGGSSDAAATLTALDRLWNLQTPRDRLESLAGQLGSDVPFFLHLPAAVCRGRGEQVEPTRLPAVLDLVLVCPPVGLATAEVYRGLVPPERPRPLGPVLEALAADDRAALGRALFNRLQPAAEAIRPELARVRQALEDLGPLLVGHLLSGSGSAYFGLARDRTAAQAAAQRLGAAGLGRLTTVSSITESDLSSSPA
jgi:4-diphosphocytidyl-2-C-methyl-D-erythritol kinase